MPVTKQAAKKVRQDKRKAVFNLKVKRNLKNAISLFRKSPSKLSLSEVFKAIDKAAKTNVIHKNKASRIKSRLSKLLGVKTKSKPKK